MFWCEKKALPVLTLIFSIFKIHCGLRHAQVKLESHGNKPLPPPPTSESTPAAPLTKISPIPRVERLARASEHAALGHLLHTPSAAAAGLRRLKEGGLPPHQVTGAAAAGGEAGRERWATPARVPPSHGANGHAQFLKTIKNIIF